MCILEEVVGNEGEEGIRLRESGKHGVYREQSQFHMNVHVTNHAWSSHPQRHPLDPS